MPYTILSATFANEDDSAAVAITQEAAAVALSARDTPEEWENLMAWREAGGNIEEFVVPPPPPEPTPEQKFARLGITKDDLLAILDS